MLMETIPEVLLSPRGLTVANISFGKLRGWPTPSDSIVRHSLGSEQFLLTKFNQRQKSTGPSRSSFGRHRTMTTPIRLIIADDHAIFRDGLKSLLRLKRDMRVVAEVDSVGALTKVLDDTTCDVLLLNLQMERWALDDIGQLATRTKVMVLTASENMENAITAMRLGARAVVQKRFAVQTLMEAIHAVANGSVWMPPALQAEVVNARSVLSDSRLTSREAQIVRLVATGLRNAEITERLSITEATLKTHLNNIFEKLEVRDRTELAVYALRHRLVMGQDCGGGSDRA